MERSGMLLLNIMVVLLMHSQSQTSFLAISFSFKGLILIDTKILSSWPLDPCKSPNINSSPPNDDHLSSRLLMVIFLADKQARSSKSSFSSPTKTSQRILIFNEQMQDNLPYFHSFL